MPLALAPGEYLIVATAASEIGAVGPVEITTGVTSGPVEGSGAATTTAAPATTMAPATTSG